MTKRHQKKPKMTILSEIAVIETVYKCSHPGHSKECYGVNN